MELLNVEQQVKAYCVKIGSDPLLVQGAGGNVSWKNGDILWIKASGTWLVEAEKKEIFLAVNLSDLRTAIDLGDYSAAPTLLRQSKLRPSIETHLHALMPHEIVIHLHPVEILAHLVRDNCSILSQSLANTNINWAMVNYFKPGADLAEAVRTVLNKSENIDVVFLQNHGVVIGGANVTEINIVLNKLLEVLKIKPFQYPLKNNDIKPVAIDDKVIYYPVEDQSIHQLATDPELATRVRCKWALYPDHVVFLGPHPYIYSDEDSIRRDLLDSKIIPDLIFIINQGVYHRLDFSAASKAQLRCYYDVLVRQVNANNVAVLNDSQVCELLNWDAEKYRMSMRNL